MVHKAMTALFVMLAPVSLSLAGQFGAMDIGVAAALALKALGPHDPEHRGRVEQIKQPPFSPEFYHMETYWVKGGAEYNGPVFAVNPWTGDVWDVVGCRRVTNADIRKVQETVRRESKLTAAELGALHALRPACMTR